jgi:glycosyltransferase involved in cell wall biosynthesis
MKISIAVPSYNYGAYLTACLQSIAEQEHSDFEVLIADGGSADDSLQIAQRFAARDARFRVVSTADRGQADAVQRAFSQAGGDIFGFLNADDMYLQPTALSEVASAFTANETADVISFGGCYVAANGSVIKRVRLRYHPLDSLERIRFRPSVLQPATF